ncbi:unnamed protein product [Heligmosomoides polygyrus]|uniref:Secreted protein n=1 Tax=Heligmosomoides polygyrus TaxID=6339 RepID=A0A183GNP6_HELPZ|nr:unnamed protein product [Heligmosomoides polygyrus]
MLAVMICIAVYMVFSLPECIVGSTTSRAGFHLLTDLRRLRTTPVMGRHGATFARSSMSEFRFVCSAVSVTKCMWCRGFCCRPVIDGSVAVGSGGKRGGDKVVVRRAFTAFSAPLCQQQACHSATLRGVIDYTCTCSVTRCALFVFLAFLQY